MRSRGSPARSSAWLPLMVLAAAVIAPTIYGQPTFDECKIFMVASDVGRDLILQKEPDYIRFLNLVARTHFIPHGFETYDELPAELQNLYKAYAWTEKQEVDISAAMFGAPASPDELLVLQAFCNETSDYIASTIQTEMPTWAPTAVPPEFDETASPSTLLPQLNRDIANGVNTIPDGHTTELPIQCRRGMFGSDTDRDGFLTPAEYTTFVNRLSTNAYAHAAHFEALPQELQDNFYRLSETDGVALLNVYGAIPSQWSEATRTQQQFLTLICHRTESALMAAHNNSEGGVTPTATEPPLIILPDTTNPLANATVPPATTPPATVPPTAANNTSNEASSTTTKGKKKMNKNAVAAIVGSILIVLLGIYLAHDKTNFFRNAHSKLKKLWFQAHTHWRNSRVQPQPSSSFRDKQTPESGHFDVEEQTGFLEDQRMCTLNTVIDQQINSNANGDFNTIRFNPDDHIPTISEDVESVTSVYDIPTDSEEPQNKHDQTMGFSFDDEDAGIASDDESLYCNSISGHQAKASANVSQAPKMEQPETESISPETQYSAKRMEPILHSESRDGGQRMKKNIPVEGEPFQTRTSKRNRLERAVKRNKLEQRTKRDLEGRRTPASKPSPTQKSSAQHKPAGSMDRFQKYSMDMSDSSESSWDNGEELSLGLEEGSSVSGGAIAAIDNGNNTKMEDSLETSSTTFQDSDPLVDSSDGDSTYNGTETESSFGIQSDSERPDDDDVSVCSKLSEIHRLVRKVLPGETGSVNRMLIQYKGREGELLNTMRRLEARVDAKNATGRPILATSPSMDASTNAATHRRTALLERASTVSENAELLASALTYGQIHGAKNPYDRGAKSDKENSNDDASFCKGGINWGPSADIDDDDFSKDSTYFEASTHAGDDETISLFSHN